jgi:glucokinase
VDTGATNTRLSLGTAAPGQEVAAAKFQADSVQTLARCLGELGQQLVAAVPEAAASIRGGCLAAAGRVFPDGDGAEVTNYRAGAAHQLLLRDSLPRLLFTPARTRIINDLESCCFGISALHRQGQLARYFKQLTPPADAPGTIEMTHQHCKPPSLQQRRRKVHRQKCPIRCQRNEGQADWAQKWHGFWLAQC